jgi:hypothetical protein
MVSIYELVKDVTFEPCLFDKVDVKLLEFHGCDEVFISGVVMWIMGEDCSVRVTGAALKAMLIFGDNLADDGTPGSWWGGWCPALDGPGQRVAQDVCWWGC